ncbi:MAG: hypothetical protein J2P57_15560 [Acidimicrobiaceae bacterium]|nr:hypothetical protein [Acidimicrobiaceae bacterium]
MTVAHHQAMAVVVEVVGIAGDVVRHLGLEGGGQHPGCAVAADLVQHRPGVLVTRAIGQ